MPGLLNPFQVTPAGGGSVGTPQVAAQSLRISETTSPVSYPTVVNSGDCLVLAGSVNSTSNTNITTPAGWTQVAQLALNGPGAPTIYAAIKFADGTEGGGTINVTHAVSVTSSWQILAFPGVNATTPQDATATTVAGATTTTTSDLPSLTVVTNGAALVAIGGQGNTSSTATPPTGFTETADRTSGTRPSFEVSYLLGVAPGATGVKSITWNVTAKTNGILLALRPA